MTMLASGVMKWADTSNAGISRTGTGKPILIGEYGSSHTMTPTADLAQTKPDWFKSGVAEMKVF